jgi:hypothetical protein
MFGLIHFDLLRSGNPCGSTTQLSSIRYPLSRDSPLHPPAKMASSTLFWFDSLGFNRIEPPKWVPTGNPTEDRLRRALYPAFLRCPRCAVDVSQGIGSSFNKEPMPCVLAQSREYLRPPISANRSDLVGFSRIAPNPPVHFTGSRRPFPPDPHFPNHSPSLLLRFLCLFAAIPSLRSCWIYFDLLGFAPTPR